MAAKFTFADINTNFPKLTKEGITGAILSDNEQLVETVKACKDFGIEVIIRLTPDKSNPIKMILPDGERTAFSDKIIRSVSLRGIKNVLNKLGNSERAVSGFIIPVPEINFPVWSNALERMCRFETQYNDILYELFSDETEVSNVRLWYCENVQKYIMKRYMLPQKNFLESIGKRAIFDIGKAEIQYDFKRRMINPLILKEKGYSLGFHPLGATEEMGLECGDLLMYNDYCEQIEDKVDREILMVKPARGVMQRYVWDEPEDSLVETPSRILAFESVYYCDMLRRSGYAFDVCDEYSFKKAEAFKKYKHILICPSCLFLKRELKVIEQLKGAGITVNNEKLLTELSQKGEE